MPRLISRRTSLSSLFFTPALQSLATIQFLKRKVRNSGVSSFLDDELQALSEALGISFQAFGPCAGMEGLAAIDRGGSGSPSSSHKPNRACQLLFHRPHSRLVWLPISFLLVASCFVGVNRYWLLPASGALELDYAQVLPHSQKVDRPPRNMSQKYQLLEQVYHSADVFRRNYREMEQEFRIFWYPDGDPVTYYQTPRKLTGKYSSEGYFFQNLRESQFLTNDSETANLFFIPISCHKMRGKVSLRFEAAVANLFLASM